MGTIILCGNLDAELVFLLVNHHLIPVTQRWYAAILQDLFHDNSISFLINVLTFPALRTGTTPSIWTDLHNNHSFHATHDDTTVDLSTSFPNDPLSKSSTSENEGDKDYVSVGAERNIPVNEGDHNDEDIQAKEGCVSVNEKYQLKSVIKELYKPKKTSCKTTERIKNQLDESSCTLLSSYAT